MPFEPEVEGIKVRSSSLNRPPSDDGDLVTRVPPTCRIGLEAMGCLFEAMIWGEDREWCAGVATEALAEVEKLDRQLSHYRDDSDIARLNAYGSREWVRVEPELFRLLETCAALTKRTRGAFDISAGALLDCWGFHRGTGRIPSSDEIDLALAQSGMERVLLRPEANLVHFTAPQLALNLGAVGKGYALDRAAEALRFYGARSALLHGGLSTIIAVGAPPDADAWQFIIRDPRDRAVILTTVGLRDAALSSSGGYKQYVEADGMRYGHILDPRTGRPAEGVIAVSAVAACAAEADAMSTALFVLGPQEASDLVAAYPELRYVMLYEDGSGGAISRAGLP